MLARAFQAQSLLVWLVPLDKERQRAPPGRRRGYKQPPRQHIAVGPLALHRVGTGSLESHPPEAPGILVEVLRGESKPGEATLAAGEEVEDAIPTVRPRFRLVVYGDQLDVI